LEGNVKRIVNITITESMEEENLVKTIADFLNENSVKINIKQELITHCRVSPDYADKLEKLVRSKLKIPTHCNKN